MIPTTIGKPIGISAGSSMLLIAEPVTMSIAWPYSGRAVPSMIPGISRNWRRTSVTTWPPTRPTASIASDANRNGIRPPMKRPAITHGVVEREGDLEVPHAEAVRVAVEEDRARRARPSRSRSPS